MEISDIAEWFDDLEVSLKRIHKYGIGFQGDDESSSLEIEIIVNGGIDGLIRLLERKALLGCDHSYIYATILSYTYDISTILVTPEHISDFTEYTISIVPKCKTCFGLFPAYLDISSFKVCERCHEETSAHIVGKFKFD